MNKWACAVSIRDVRVYTFTKLYVSVHEYGIEQNLVMKMKKMTKAVDRRTWYFLQFTAKLSDNWMNELLY